MLLAATTLGAAARAEAADIVNLGAARVAGAQGSDWHDRQLVMDKGEGSSFTVYVTPRGQAFSMSDPSLSMVLTPGETRVINDLYEQLLGEGAGSIRIQPDQGSEAPVWRSVVFNQDGAAEFGMTSKPFSEENDGYHSNTTLAAMLSPAGFRDNIDLVTGDAGVTGQWVYTNSAGGNQQTIDKTYNANTTEQFAARALLGFEPEPGSRLEFEITDGSARMYLSRNHNESNDPSRDEFEAVTAPVNPADAAIAYVNHWLPRNDSGFYLNNTEIRAMINGGMGTQSYARDMAEIFFDHTSPQLPGDVDMLEQVLRDYADGSTSNDELYHGFDPFQWTSNAGCRTYDEPDGAWGTDFNMDAEGRQLIYDLVKGIDANGEPNDGFLWRFVQNNPHRYNSNSGSPPDMDHNPTWNTQDPN